MELESVTLKLPRDLLSGAQRVATARDVTIGHMVRQLLKREVARQLSGNPTDAPAARLLAALQALLARDMADATGWDDLAERLRPHGYDLRPVGGGIFLYKTSCNTRVCKGSEIGFGYSALVKRFGCAMPEHPHTMAHLGTMPAGQIDPKRHTALCVLLEGARNWPDLINRLAIEGMEVRALGAESGIYNARTGRHLCNTASLSAPYRTLVRRFGAEIPCQRLPENPQTNDADLVEQPT